jgi:2-iminobutanoate/2-iminopropanoate deaminase
VTTSSVQLLNPQGIAPPKGYSHVARISAGTTVFIAGQVALDEAGALVGQDDVRAQAERVFANLNAAVVAVGGTFHDIVKLTYYLIDIRNLAVVREVRDRYVNLDHPPVSTAIEVSRLFQPAFLIEVEAVAVIGAEA